MPTQETPSGHLVIRLLCLGCALLIPVATLPMHLSPASAQPEGETAAIRTEQAVEVDGRALFMLCEGTGGPLVILENGLGGQSSDWDLVFPGLAGTTTVCAYDRAGEGRSDPDSSGPHDASDAARDLDAVLAALDPDGPVVLAGFSIGGLLARYYAATRSDTVGALVLIDATPPVWTAMNLSGGALEPRIDALLRFSGVHPRVAEQLDLLKASEQVFMQSAPRLPVFMISAGIKTMNPGMAGDAEHALAHRLQRDQANELDAQHRIISGCAHAMPVDCPGEVVQIILDAVDEVRRSRAYPESSHADALLSGAPIRRRMSRGNDNR